MEQAVVIKSTGSWYVLKNAQNELIDARVKGKFRIKGMKTTNPVAVGDEVMYFMNEDDRASIAELIPRNNYIVRKPVNLSKQYHIIASNIDQLVIIASIADPVTTTGFIDRMLLSAEAYHIPAVLVFNKSDLVGDNVEHKEHLMDVYSSIGYQCVETSTVTGENIEAFKSILKGKRSLLSGHSGVGKSTLINTIEPELDLRTNEISDMHRQGKHTTTFAEMFELGFGGEVIDTPGIRGFGLVDFEKHELAAYFPEFVALAQSCKFNNCVHLNEPHCAVKEALEKGEIAGFRMKNYRSIYNDDVDENYRALSY